MNKWNNCGVLDVNDFYSKYPTFDLLFYKKYYSELLSYNTIHEYYIHYHTIGFNNDYIYSFDYLLEKYNIDLDFIKVFYENKLLNKNNCEISIILKHNIENWILSEKDFYNKYPSFSIKIYLLLHPIFDYDKSIIYSPIKFIKYWYNNDINNNNIIYSIDNFLNIYNDINISLFTFLYSNNENIEELTDDNVVFFYKNKDQLIYSLKTFLDKIDDFSYSTIIDNYTFLRNKSEIDIVKYYIDNIHKINYFYSIKLFLEKYPKYKIDEFKIMYNKKNENNLDLCNYIYNEIILKNNFFYSSFDEYFEKFDFNLIIYKYYIKENEYIKFEKDIEYIIYFFKNNHENLYKTLDKNIDIYLYEKCNILYKNDIQKKYLPYFDFEFYRKINNLNENLTDIEIFIHFYENKNINIPYCIENVNDITFNLNLNIYRSLNKDLNDLTNKELVYHCISHKDDKRIYSIKSFQEYYNKDLNEKQIIDWMLFDIYKSNKEGYKGRIEVNNIYEVLIDLEHQNNYPKESLKNGISLIIRAKNEELNIKICIESVIDLVDEIIFVDNNSTDNTYNLVYKYAEKYDKIKLYKYNVNVSKVGKEHYNAIQTKNPNTLGNFYNWCLTKTNYTNVMKWDADFICIRNNFKCLIDTYKLKTNNDKFAIWFTGLTLFENNNLYYINPNSYYNEFRIFSFKNNFQWYDGESCEYVEPYLKDCHENKKYIFEYPLFYELKRTSINEFEQRSSMIDIRDINDNRILTNLKNNSNNELIKIEYNNIILSKTIYILTPSLKFGGGNQFVIQLYTFYKSIGYNIKIISTDIDNIDISKFGKIIKNDILSFHTIKISFVENTLPDMIFLNSDIYFNENDLIKISKITKLYLITHSDVSYSNIFVEKYNSLFDKIITVNNYTIEKLSKSLNINNNKFYKLINYIPFENIKNHNKIRNKKFGVISRFSDDKNIPMLLFSLMHIFNKYPNYKCYLVGSHNNKYDQYLKQLIFNFKLESNVIFEGYQSNVHKYYEMFDFVILPSVSEGCPYNLIEAMAHGVPIIASNVGGNHELIQNNINGFLIEYLNIRDIEKKNVYIHNYNEHLSTIGYIINNDNLKHNTNVIIDNIQKDFNILLPFGIKCLSNKKDCNICSILSKQNSILLKNSNNIKDTIIKMIETTDEEWKYMSNNNIEFIKNQFSKNIYYSQLLFLSNT